MHFRALAIPTRRHVQPRLAPAFLFKLLTLGALASGPMYAPAAVVPWLDEAAPFPNAPAAAAPAQRPCAVADLAIALGPQGAFRGRATQEILVRNTAAEPCYLQGASGLELLSTGGKRAAIHEDAALAELSRTRLDFAPGDTASLLIGTSGGCDATIGPNHQIATRLRVAPLGGGATVVEGAHVDITCGPPTLMQMDRQLTERSPSSATARQHLVAGLTAPDSATAGAALAYVVTLANPTDQAIALAPCPAYTQTLNVDGQPARSAGFRLNCAAAGNLVPAHGQLQFEMRAPIPAGWIGAGVKLSWQLHDGPSAGAIVPLR